MLLWNCCGYFRMLLSIEDYLEGFWVVASVIFLLIGVVVCVLGYIYVVKNKMEYSKAREEIFIYVKSYKRRVTGSNRFEVSVEALQDVFREYETEIINKVWLELIKERVIEQDPNDNVWCVR